MLLATARLGGAPVVGVVECSGAAVRSGVGPIAASLHPGVGPVLVLVLMVMLVMVLMVLLMLLSRLSLLAMPLIEPVQLRVGQFSEQGHKSPQVIAPDANFVRSAKFVNLPTNVTADFQQVGADQVATPVGLAVLQLFQRLLQRPHSLLAGVEDGLGQALLLSGRTGRLGPGPGLFARLFLLLQLLLRLLGLAFRLLRRSRLSSLLSRPLAGLADGHRLAIGRNVQRPASTAASAS